jgi:hypothetical protein
MFLVLRTRFATSAWGQICIRNIVDTKMLNRASLHRLFRVGATVYLPDIYESHFTLCIAQNASLDRLFRMGKSDYPDDNLCFFSMFVTS